VSAPVTRWLQVGHHWRRVPEQPRSATHAMKYSFGVPACLGAIQVSLVLFGIPALKAFLVAPLVARRLGLSRLAEAAVFVIHCCLLALPLGAVGQASGPGPRPGVPWENSLGMKFVPVPGTNVLFCIWETRVQDFEAFVTATGYNAGQGWRDPGAVQSYAAGFTQTPLHPVVNVSWHDAVAFCRWLTEKEQAAGKLSTGEFRLPTDAEWSLAVGLPPESGATPEDKNGKIPNVYPWGTGYPPPEGSGNYSSEGDGWYANRPVKIDGYTDGARFTAKVGSYTANRLGIYDLGGNVWEWCGDWFNADRTDRAIRGASFNQSVPGFLLSSLHGRKPPGVREYNLGFRCVVTVGAFPPPTPRVPARRQPDVPGK